MNPPRPSPVLRLADAIVEGSTVDWEHERQHRPELVATFDCLKVVENIFQGYRACADAAPGPRTSTPPPRSPIPRLPSKGARRKRAKTLFHWGPLQAIAKLGEGAFGEVYRAFDPSLEREVALKLWRYQPSSNDSLERLVLEARRLARVRHPNVLVVHGVDEHDGRSGMWTDLIEGQSLEQLLVRQGPWGHRESTLIGIELCRALAAVHAVGLVHRDVKTTNVMRERGGRVVLMDFGSVGEWPRFGVMSDEGLVGTPLTLAPEQLAGAPVSPATDVYAVGVLVYRMLTGAYPIEAATFEELRAKHRLGQRTSLRERRPDLPTGFVAAVEKALEPDLDDRYDGPAALERGLAATLDVLPSSSAAVSCEAGAAAATRDARRPLPEVMTLGFARDGELETCATLALESRWLTLTGPSGCGKTRLAMRLAEKLAPEFPDGPCFVDLEPLASAERLPQLVASAMGAEEIAESESLPPLIERLAKVRALLVLDHGDHLMPEATRAAEALWRGCANLVLIATSAEPWKGVGERTHAVAEGAEIPAPPTAPAAVPFVGRRHELAVFDEAIASARRRGGRTILLSGEAGVGKSRLMTELRARAESRGVLCLGSQCSYQSGRNFEPFVEAFEEFFRRFGAGGARPLIDEGSRTGETDVPFATLRALLQPGGHAVPEPRTREQIWRALDALLKRIARYETLALFLDDLHWADEGSLALMNHVTRNLGNARLLVVGSYRSEELRAPSGPGILLEDTVRMLSAVPAFTLLPIAALGPDESAALVGAVFQDVAAGRERAAAIHERAQGNPFFTIEIVRYLSGRPREGSGDGGASEPALPQTITDVIMRRLARLSAEERDALDVAAVEGVSFDPDTLASGTGLQRLSTLKLLRDLEQVHQLVVSGPSGYRFSHGLIREVLLRAMPAEMRREYHSVVADLLARRHGARADCAGRIGDQLVEANRFAEALPFLAEAAREARRLFLNDRALAFLERALDAHARAKRTSLDRGELLRSKSEVLLLLGRPHLARGVAEEALEEEERHGDDAGRGASYEGVGEAALAQGDLAAAEKFLTGARERYATIGVPHHVARCDQKLGAAATRRGDFEQGLARLDAAIEGMKASGGAVDVARIRLDIGDVLYRRGDYDRAIETFERAVQDLRQLSARHDLARGINRLGNAMFQSGRTDLALVHYEEGLALAAQLGDVQGMARLGANLGNVHLVRGDPERAARSYREALASFVEIGDQTGAGQTLVALGNVCFTLGRFDEAADFYRNSIQAREAMGDRWGLANSLDNLGVVEYHLGRFSLALEHQRAALRLRTELGDRPGCAESAINLGSLMAVIGDREAARSFHAEALRGATEIGDPRKIARARLACASLCLGSDDLEGGREVLRSVQDLARDEPSLEARRLLLEGLASAENPESAEARLREALAQAERSGSIVELSTARLAVARRHLESGRRDEARAVVDIVLESTGGGRLPLLELHALRLAIALERQAPGAELMAMHSEDRLRALIDDLSGQLPTGRSAAAAFHQPLFPPP